MAERKTAEPCEVISTATEKFSVYKFDDPVQKDMELLKLGWHSMGELPNISRLFRYHVIR